jgi:hypothetical protein
MILSYLDIKMFDFVLKLTECYKAVSNWPDLLKWKEKEAELLMHQNGGTPTKYVSFGRNVHPVRLRHL